MKLENLSFPCAQLIAVWSCVQHGNTPDTHTQFKSRVQYIWALRWWLS